MNILAVSCNDVAFVIRIIKLVITIVRWAIPILLIALITFDLVKGMTQKSDDEMRKSTSKIVTRVIWAVAIFFVPLLLKWIFGMFGTTTQSGLNGPGDWVRCYNSINI